MRTLHISIAIDMRLTIVSLVDDQGLIDSDRFTPSGVELYQAFIDYLRTEHHFLIDRLSADNTVLAIGSAYVLEIEEEKSVDLKGRNLDTDLPELLRVSSNQVYEAIDHILYKIIKLISVKTCRMFSTYGDQEIIDPTIIVTGEYCKLHGLSKRLQEAIRSEMKTEIYISTEN